MTGWMLLMQLIIVYFFQFCHLETQKRRRRKRRKLKKNQIVTDDVIMTSCDQPFYHVFILLFYRLVRMLKEEREREVENVPVVFRVIYVNSLLRIICYILPPVNRLIGFIYPIMLVVFIYMTVWGVESSCLLKKKDKSSSKKLQTLWKHLPGIFISWLFPFYYDISKALILVQYGQLFTYKKKCLACQDKCLCQKHKKKCSILNDLFQKQKQKIH